MAEKHPKTKAKAATAFSTYRTLWRRFLSPHRGLLALAVFCGAAAAATAGFGLPMMMDKVFPVVFGEKPLPEFLQRAIAGRVPAESVPALTMWCAAAAMPLLMVFRGAASFANTYLISKIEAVESIPEPRSGKEHRNLSLTELSDIVICIK